MAELKKLSVCIRFCFKPVEKNAVENFGMLKVAFVKHKMKRLNFWASIRSSKICDLCLEVRDAKDIG